MMHLTARFCCRFNRYTDEIEMEDEGMAEIMLDDNSTAEIPRSRAKAFMKGCAF